MGSENILYKANKNMPMLSSMNAEKKENIILVRKSQGPRDEKIITPCP